MFLSTVDVLGLDRHFRRVHKDIVKIVGSTIRRLREEQGLSQEAFAQRAQLDRSFYGRVERGTQNIAITTLCVVAGGLRVHPSKLLADIKPEDLQAMVSGAEEERE